MKWRPRRSNHHEIFSLREKNQPGKNSLLLAFRRAILSRDVLKGHLTFVQCRWTVESAVITAGKEFISSRWSFYVFFFFLSFLLLDVVFMDREKKKTCQKSITRLPSWLKPKPDREIDHRLTWKGRKNRIGFNCLERKSNPNRRALETIVLPPEISSWGIIWRRLELITRFFPPSRTWSALDGTKREERRNVLRYHVRFITSAASCNTQDRQRFQTFQPAIKASSQPTAVSAEYSEDRRETGACSFSKNDIYLWTAVLIKVAWTGSSFTHRRTFVSLRPRDVTTASVVLAESDFNL